MTKKDASDVPVKITPEKPLPRRKRVVVTEIIVAVMITLSVVRDLISTIEIIVIISAEVAKRIDLLLEQRKLN